MASCAKLLIFRKSLTAVLGQKVLLTRPLRICSKQNGIGNKLSIAPSPWANALWFSSLIERLCVHGQLIKVYGSGFRIAVYEESKSPLLNAGRMQAC